MSQKCLQFLKKVIISIIFAILSSLIGIVINYITSTFTEAMLSSVPSKKGLNSYEKQILDTVINPSNINEKLETVGGLSDIKEDIKTNILLPLKHPHIFFASSILRPSRGIILHGPPGTGKTMLAKAIAAEANVPFLSLTLSTLENKYFGESGKLIRATFSLARKLQPCIVFFDEIDGLMRQRSELDQSAVYGFKTELLSQIDGMSTQASDSIFIIGTTNNLQYLDAAIKRRLPKLYEVKLPNQIERLDILKLKVKEDINHDILKWVANETDTFSGSDLEELVRRASSFRLQEQCADDDFQCQLEHAKCILDINTLKSLSKEHFLKAMEVMVGYTIDEGSSETDEEAPPT